MFFKHSEERSDEQSISNPASYTSDVLMLVLFLPLIFSVFGWRCWIRRRNETPKLTLSALVLGSASIALAVGTAGYAVFIRDFPFYDPTLMSIYLIGSALSLLACILAIAQSRLRSRVGLYAGFLGAAMFLFWLLAASGE